MAENDDHLLGPEELTFKEILEKLQTIYSTRGINLVFLLIMSFL